MTGRTIGGVVYTLTHDAENRLTAMAGGVTASYVYDADGNRVKETITGVTRVFIGNYYELDNGVVKKYYHAGATRVAENSGGVLYYLLTDHLGSTALTLNSSGVRVTELRYYPFGAARYNANNQVTTYRFTGQRWDSGTALYFYQSRWYDPLIGRFLAADTIVPQPQNPQNLNRYSYCGSNPLRFVDPSGHAGVDFWGGGGAGAGVGLIVALMQGAQQTMTQVQGAVYQYGPVAAEITWLYGNQTIAAGDQISQAVQNASQAGNTASSGGNPSNWDPNQFKFKDNSSLRSHFEKHVVKSADEAWEEVLGVSRSQLEAARSDPGQLARLQDAYVQVGQQTSRASNYIGVQAQGQRVFIDTSNKIVSIMQGDRFLSLYRITRWEQFLASMKGKGLQFAPGVDWETLRMAMGQ
jgi:RHS repeat-associated protein